ncbi:MAG: hypothetical protein U0746_10600 [Gemmataceae bacterium]
MILGICRHCETRPVNGASLFCSPECRAEFAKTMPELIECSDCDAQADSIAEATAAGWTEIDPDPEGYSWNYLGLCPECRAVEEAEDAEA